MPVSTNKLGAVEAIKALAPKLEGFEKLFVTVNRDSSGNYGPGLSAIDVINVGHLQPGFQRYFREVCPSLAASVSNPPKGYEIAATYVAEWLRTFATQPAVQGLVGAVPALNDYEPAPGPLRFGVPSLDHVTNAALTENLRRSRILDAIDEAEWTGDGLRKVATKIDLKLL